MQGRRTTQTDCKDPETRKHIAIKMKHENGVQGKRNKQTECTEEDTRKRNARREEQQKKLQ